MLEALLVGLVLLLIGWLCRKALWPWLVQRRERWKLFRAPVQKVNLPSIKTIHGRRPLLQAMAMRMYEDSRSPHSCRENLQLFRHSADGCTVPLPLIEMPEGTPATLLQLDDVRLDWIERAESPPALWPNLASRLRTELGQHIENDEVYTLRTVYTGVGKTLCLRCGIDRYDNYVNSCEALNWSLCTAVKKWEQKPFGRAIRSIDDPHRVIENASAIGRFDQLRRNIDPLDFTNRVCAIGINTLTVLASAGRHHFFLHDRGKDRGVASTDGSRRTKAEAVGTVHVVPAGSFQPVLSSDRDHGREFSIEFTLIREFAEEILGHEIERRFRNEANIESLLNASENKVLKDLIAFFEKGKVKTFFLGIGLDVLTLKPELLSLCLVNESALRQTFQIPGNWEGELDLKEFTRMEIDAILAKPEDNRLLGAASGALALSYRHFDAISEHLATLAR